MSLFNFFQPVSDRYKAKEGGVKKDPGPLRSGLEPYAANHWEQSGHITAFIQCEKEEWLMKAVGDTCL